MRLVLIGLMLLLIGCNGNDRARNWSGTETIELDAGKKLVNLTWKDNNLWVLTRDSKDGEGAEEYNFAEKSAWGILEGKVIIKEK